MYDKKKRIRYNYQKAKHLLVIFYATVLLHQGYINDQLQLNIARLLSNIIIIKSH